jgi:phage shock protein A
MLKKSLSAALSAALIVSGLPFGAVSAVAANTQSRAGVVPTVSLTGMPGIASPVAGMASMPGANVGMRADNVLPPTLPSARVSAAQAVQAAATAQRQPEAKASVTANVAPALAAAAAPKASAETGRSAIGSIYEGTRLSRSGQAADVAGRESNGTTLPAATGAPSTKRSAGVEQRRSNDGGLIAEVGIGVAALGVLGYIFSPSFRNLVKRAWNAMLGVFGMGVKKMETPEVMAQRIIDQLNEQKPIYNRKVQEASTLVEKLRLQVEGEQKKFDELEKTITALLSDSDPNNDILTTGMIKEQQILKGSIAANKEQVALSEKMLEGIKEERARFFMEREELLAKIQAGLTKSKAAEIQKQMAELKGGFKVGDLKDNLDKFEDAVNDKVADAKGHQDSVESNPDEIIKKAKDSLRNQEVQDEIARRKAEIEAKKKGNGQSGGAVFNAVGWFAKAIAVGFAFLAPTIATFVFAGMGLIALIMEPSKAQSFGRSLAVIGGITLALGGAFAFGAAHFGLAIGAFGSGLGWTVPGLLALTAGIFSAIRARKRGAAVEASMPASTTPTMTPVPSAEPAASSPSTSAPSAKGPSVLKSLGELWKRFWNALLGIFGMGVKKMETPEILAQRMIDQLNAAKPVYNQKVADAASLVEKLKIQIEKQQKTSKELDTTITAILSDSNPDNDHLAAVMIKQKSALDASTAATQEQAAIAAKTLEGIKEERARFFAEREEALAKIQAGLTKAKAAEVQKQMAELKGGFKVGDIGDNMGRFEDAVNDKVSDAKGHQDAVDSNPEEIIKKAKESMRDQEVQDELKRRRDEIAKNKAGK